MVCLFGFLGAGWECILDFLFICLLLILFLEVFCLKSNFNGKLFYEGQSKLEDMLESSCVTEELRNEKNFS